MAPTLSKRLLHAIYNGDRELCTILLGLGADVNSVGGGIYVAPSLRMLPLHAAAKRGDALLCKILIDAGAAVDTADEDWHTALHVAASGGFASACKALIEGGAQVSAGDLLLKRPLHHAAEMGWLEVCELLVKSGASLSEVDDDERIPLHEAAAGGHEQVCRFLIEAGANPNNVSAAGDTPLHCAVEKGHFDTCAILVELGADASFIPRDPWPAYTTPFQTALEYGRLDIARFFILRCNEDLDQRTLSDKAMEDICLHSSRGLLLALRTELEVGRAVGGGDVAIKTSGRTKSSSISPL
jgi:ankyrin repeat protein